MCSDVCPWTLSVSRSSQFFSSYALGKLGTDNVRGQLSEHISAPNGGYYLYISLQIKAISKFFIKGHVAALVRSHINGLKPFDRTIKQTTETMVLAPKQ